MRRALLALLMASAPAVAQQAVVSPAAETSSVTVYRDPDRNGNGAMNLGWLQGFALITETRTVDLPMGESVIRFEGVAEGIMPVSAIVTGLPGGVIEKNRDARLLSPAALVDGTIGGRVHLRRTNRATGTVIEEEAVIRSGPQGGVVLQTAGGVEALGCAGLPEDLVYDRVPAGLSDKPTLSVTTHSPVAGPARVTLSYLAGGFDWQADYIAQIAPGGQTLDLFAWLTLANGNGESFPDAQTQVVAGTLNREDRERGMSMPAPQLYLQCWPMGSTSEGTAIPPPPPPAPGAYNEGMEDIVVTASRRAEMVMPAPIAAMEAAQEELGDLKLYRIPEPVTVAANAQKQVSLLTKAALPFDRLYGASLAADGEADWQPVQILIRMKNIKAKGLGVPLPSGSVVVFETADGRSMVAGETAIEDKAIGQEVELTIGASPQVQISQKQTSADDEDTRDGRRRSFTVEISNANPEPALVEVSLHQYDADWSLVKPSRKLGMKDGRTLWTVKVPGNGNATLDYALRRRADAAD